MRNVLRVAILTGLMAVAGPTFASETPAAGGGGAGGAAGAGTKNDGNSCDLDTVTKNFESRGSGGYSASNQYGYQGAYQMGGAALTDIGYKYEVSKGSGVYKWTGKDQIYSNDDWKKRPDIQEKAQQLWKAKQSEYIKPWEGQFIGKDASQFGCNGGTVTHEGILAAAHLVGHGGARTYFQNGGACTAATKDGNGQCARVRLCAMANCKPIEKDYSKKTCDVTMPMIEAIDCSNFTGELQAFCQKTKPHLMTRPECNAAESWAERAPKGPQRESCEGQTFGPGTGSWSYVLACSYMDPVTADNDGVPNQSSGPTKDPECMNKLRGMGVEFDELGQVNNGTYNGTVCIVENAIAYRGKAIPFGSRQTMTCELAYTLEKFGEALRGIGVVGYEEVGSNRKCMSMIDDRGAFGSAKPTTHAFGQAMDIGKMVHKVHGVVSMGVMRNAPNTPAGQFALEAREIGCRLFDQVLSPLYGGYKSYHHFHLEKSGTRKNCK